ncbi:uncharacterized protein LOC115671589 isoform X2 [Syzygium oleosum]|uniref:uncharacterized protein LOC115671589 isoform X2 n=1 Tax=Syzygium oleosum TaxID=219896 RepID=UPI0024B9C063|nr:uncharacterized protein LOC115671589 isoform X2 [Syzygium oleosum]
MFKVVKSGKRKTKQWKRMVTKATFVGPGFTRKPPKYERFIRPSGLQFNKAHVMHPELKCTFNLEITGVKKNPNGQMYTSLGVLTKGAVIEVKTLIDIASNEVTTRIFLWILPPLRTHLSLNITGYVSKSGLVTPAGKVVRGKNAQVTNDPENDGFVNAVLLV